MGTKVHVVSGIDQANRTATCAGCGPASPVIFKSHKGRWVCRVGDARRSPEAKALRRALATPAARRKYNLASKFGITPDEYAAMHLAQGGVCAICLRPCRTGRHLAVDHDHETGRIRGLLCSRCNRGIGMLGDSPDVMRSAIRYLMD